MYTPKEIVVTQTVPARVADVCDKFFEMDRRHTNPALKSLVFGILRLNNKCNKLMKVSSHCTSAVTESSPSTASSRKTTWVV